MPALQEKLLSAAEAAEQLGISKKTLYKYCHDRLITYVPLPGYTYIDKEDGKKYQRPGPYKFHQYSIDLFVAQHTVKATTTIPIPLKKKAA